MMSDDHIHGFRPSAASIATAARAASGFSIAAAHVVRVVAVGVALSRDSDAVAPVDRARRPCGRRGGLL